MGDLTLSFATTIVNSGQTPVATTFVVVTVPPAELSSLAREPSSIAFQYWSEPAQVKSWIASHAGSSSPGLGSSGITGGAIAGIVIGSVALLALLIVLILVLLHYRRRYYGGDKGRGRSRDGSSERGLDPSGFGSTKQEKGGEMEEQSRGKLGRLGAILIPDRRRQRTAGADTTQPSRRPIKAELGDTRRKITEMPSSDPRTNMAELHNSELSNQPEGTLDTQGSTHGSSAELDGSPVSTSYLHSDFTQRHQQELPEKGPQQFPYQGLLERNIDRHTPLYDSRQASS